MSLRFDLFTEKECSLIVDTVDQLHDLWVQRHPAIQFYTLGAATYLDKDNYHDAKSVTNPLLSDTMGWVYQVLVDVFESNMGNAALEEDLAFPGFHILGHKPGEENTNTTMSLSKSPTPSSVHIDGVLDPHRKLLNEKYSQVMEDSVISLTCAIEIPSGGAGICIWNEENPKEEEGFAYEIQQKYLDSIYGVPTVREYQLGQVFMFPGNVLHQMAPAIEPLKQDRRITLQAHAVLCDGVWRLFF